MLVAAASVAITIDHRAPRPAPSFILPRASPPPRSASTAAKVVGITSSRRCRASERTSSAPLVSFAAMAGGGGGGGGAVGGGGGVRAGAGPEQSRAFSGSGAGSARRRAVEPVRPLQESQ